MDGLSARCDGLQPVALEAIDPERILYVAIPLDTYRSFFQVEFTRIIVIYIDIPLHEMRSHSLCVARSHINIPLN